MHLLDLQYLHHGNPGAMRVLHELRSSGKEHAIHYLGRFNITGPTIWILFKDVCDQDIAKMVRVLTKAVHSGVECRKLETAIFQRHFPGVCSEDELVTFDDGDNIQQEEMEKE